MPVAAYTLPVEAPHEVVWRVLAESAAQPQRFDSQVEAVRILDSGADVDGSLLREVRRGGVTRRERVTLDEHSGSLTATLEGDVEFRGCLTLRAEAPNMGSTGHEHPRVSARLEWQPLSGNDDPGRAEALCADLQQQLLEFKQAAEAQARPQLMA